VIEEAIMALTLQRVLISDEIDQRCVDVLQSNGVEVTKNTKLSKEELIQEIQNYDGLIVRSATKVTAEVINAGPRLKIIGRAGTGVDNIDCEAATRRGVIVMNTPGGNTMSAAELTCSLIMATSRHIAAGCASLKAGRWDRKLYMGNEVFGKTLAIVGLGRIGKEVATRMQSFGMTTIGYDPITPASVAESWGVKWLPLEEVWTQADYITVHTPLIPQTRNMINDEVFAKCKKGVRIINCARGGIIDEDALLRALESGQCAGAGLDVFLEEPPKNRALVDHPRVTGTPHLGASTVEAQSRVAVEIAEQFIDARDSKSLFGAINAQALSNALAPDTRPLVTLGSCLGTLAANLAGTLDKTAQISLTTEGATLAKAGSYLGAAALVGLLKPVSQNGLNLVSAPAFAKEAGIQVTTEHRESSTSQYPAQVSVQVQLNGATFKVTGVVAAGQPVLVAVNDAALSQGVVMSGDILLYRGQDNLQVLSAVTGALSAANTAVTAFSTSAPINNERWSIMAVAAPVASIENLKLHVNYISQIQF